MEDISSMHPYLGPTLFIGGAQSNYVTEADMPSIRQIFPEATLKTIENAGHWVHADNPATFTQVILEFIRQK
jgi:pimeloyl-ACP methyl ester carboxylesterase